MRKIIGKKWWLIIGMVIIVFGVLIFLRGSEDDWIKNEQGELVPHGRPYDLVEVEDYLKSFLDSRPDISKLYRIEKITKTKTDFGEQYLAEVNLVNQVVNQGQKMKIFLKRENGQLQTASWQIE